MTRETTQAQLERTEKDIRQVCTELADMLVQKNKSYGDSALNPVRIFSRADCLEQINVRIDDKLSRMASAPEALGEDPEWDLMGYLVLKRIARRRLPVTPADAH